MKINLTIVSLFYVLACNCQVIALQDIEDIPFPPEKNVYYRDNNNLLNSFEGTYLFQDGINTFEVVLLKKESLSNNNIYFEDMLVGCYRFAVNGVMLVDNVVNLQTMNDETSSYPITSNTIIRGPWRDQNDIAQGEVWLSGSIKDDTINRSLPIFIKKKTINNQEAIEITLLPPHTTMRLESEPEPQAFALPFTESFTLIKQ
jgi:hypothetical protein